MRTLVAVSAVALAASLGVLGAAPARSQEKPVPGSRVGVLNLRDCFDKSRNAWVADIELEIQKLQEAEAGRATDLNPQERARIRTKVQDLSHHRKLEVYTAVVRISGAVAKERGFDLIERGDRMPGPEGTEQDFMAQIDRRSIIHHDPAIDITSEVLDRINREYAARKK